MTLVCVCVTLANLLYSATSDVKTGLSACVDLRIVLMPRICLLRFL